MEFHFFYDKTGSLSEEDYERIGFAGNPAYYHLRCGEVASAHVSREALESELRGMIDKFIEGQEFKHAFLCSGPPGAGKSHTQNILKDYCSEMGIPFAELNQDDSEAVEMLCYMISLSGNLILFCDCQTSKFYKKLVEMVNVCVIGSGHSPSQELEGIEASFKVYDLEKDYPLSSDDIYDMLATTLQGITLESVVPIPDHFLREVSQMTRNPGLALDALGACLAILAYKAKSGRRLEITQDDLHHCCDKHFIRWLSGFR